MVRDLRLRWRQGSGQFNHLNKEFKMSTIISAVPIAILILTLWREGCNECRKFRNPGNLSNYLLIYTYLINPFITWFHVQRSFHVFNLEMFHKFKLLKITCNSEDFQQNCIQNQSLHYAQKYLLWTPSFTCFQIVFK